MADEPKIKVDDKPVLAVKLSSGRLWLQSEDGWLTGYGVPIRD
jgi:hypothetical protein